MGSALSAGSNRPSSPPQNLPSLPLGCGNDDSIRSETALLRPTDLEDDARAGDLDERAVTGADKMRIVAIIPHCTIIGDIPAPIRAKPDIGRAIEPGRMMGAD